MVPISWTVGPQSCKEWSPGMVDNQREGSLLALHVFDIDDVVSKYTEKWLYELPGGSFAGFRHDFRLHIKQ